MICIQCQGAAIFFPDEEVKDAKPISSAGLPSIAFRSRGTGGLQFIKRFQSEEERDRTLQGIREAEQEQPKEDLTQKLMERIRATEEELEKMRKAQRQAKPKKEKKTGKAQKRPKKPFVPPEDEEIISYIKERKIDEKLGIPAEVIAESFRSVYEKEEDTGETDENGFAVRNIVWRKADGSLVENWKSCLQTFKARQLVWDAKKDTRKEEKGEEKPTKSRWKNQFTNFHQNEYTDEEFDEIEELLRV